MKITMPFKSISSMEFNETTKTTVYVDVCDIPNNIPMECNPRLQNMKSAVVKAIKQTLVEDDGLFHILNRGITITAESIKVKGNSLVIEINDFETQGCIDGGHTYKSILEYQDIIQPETQYVTIEILTGNIVMNNFVKLAMARNRSQQVQDKSLAELNNEFGWIKEAIKNENVSVIYKENEDGNVPIEFIVWLMAVTNSRFGESTCNARPKESMKAFIKYNKEHGLNIETNPFYAAKDILVDLMKVFDFMEVHFGNKIKCFSKIKVVDKGNFKSTIYGTPMKYKFPKQFLYPPYTAMRAIIGVDDKTGLLFWKTDPHAFIKRILPELALNQVNIYKADRMLERCRAKKTYSDLYKTAELLYKEITLEEREKALMNK